MANTLEMQFSLGAQLASGFATVFGNAGGIMGGFTQKIQKLNSDLGNIESFKKTEAAIKKNTEQLTKWRNQLNSLGGTGSKSEIKKLNDSMLKTNKIIDEDRNKLSQLNETLKQSKINTHDLASEHDRLTDSLEKTVAMQGKLKGLKEIFNWGNFKRDITNAAMGAFGANAIFNASKSAISFQQALTNINASSNVKTLTSGQLSNIGNYILALTNNSTVAAEDLASGLETGAIKQLGYDEQMALAPAIKDLVEATGMSAKSAASYIIDTTKWFGGTANDYRDVADLIVKGAAWASQDSESFAQQMWGTRKMAKDLGLSLSGHAALTGTLNTAQIDPNEITKTLTSFKNRLSSEAVQKELTKIGVKFKDGNNNMLDLLDIFSQYQAVLSKMGTADQQTSLSKIVGRNFIGSMLKFMPIFGSNEFRDTFEQMEANKEERLEGRGFASEAAKAAHDSLQGSLERLSKTWNNVKTIFATPIIEDVFRPFVDGVVDAVSWLSEFLSKHQDVVKYVGIIGTALSGLATSLAVYRIGAKLSNILFGDLLKNIGTVTSKIFSFGGTLIDFSKSMFTGILDIGKGIMSGVGSALGVLTSPIGLTIAGIAAVAFAAYELYQHWDEVKAAIGKGWNWLKTKITDFGEWLSNFNIWDCLSSAFDACVGKIKGLWDGLVKMFSDPISFFFDTNTTPEQAQSAKALKGKSAGEFVMSADSVSLGLSGFAKGGIINSPILSWVGEAGPEAIIPLTDRARGIPLLEKAASVLGVGGGMSNTSITFAPVINVQGGEANNESLAEQIKEAVLEAWYQIQDDQARTAWA